MVHLKGYMYKWVMQDLGKKSISYYCIKSENCCIYNNITATLWVVFLLFTDKFILRGEETDAVLHRLVSHGKKLFLITNSPFSFV